MKNREIVVGNELARIVCIILVLVFAVAGSGLFCGVAFVLLLMSLTFLD